MDPNLQNNSYTPSGSQLPPSNEGEKPASKKGLIILFVLAFVLFIATCFLAIENYRLRKEQTSRPTPKPTIQPTPTPDPTADWKTYTNEKYSFSFKYPATNPGGGDPYIIESANKDKVDIGVPDSSGIPFTVLVYPKGDIQTQYEKDKKDNSSLTPLKEIELNDLTVSETEDKSGTSQFDLQYFYITKNDILYKLIVGFAEMPQNILSTFKFTEENQASGLNCSTGYEKFTNANFSFCYPTGMKETAASTATSVVLENSTDTLKVEQNFQGSWTGSACLAINTVTIANYPSKRLSWKTEKTDGTCDTTYSSFATMVNEGIFKSLYPYLIQYSKKSGTFTDMTAFTTIESSFVPAVAN